VLVKRAADFSYLGYSITDSDHATMASVGDSVGAMNHGHERGVPEAWWNLRQFCSTEFARAELANVFVGIRMFSKPMSIGLDCLFDVIER